MSPPPIEFFIDCNPPKSTHQASLRIMKRRDGAQFVGKTQNSKGHQAKNLLIDLLGKHRPEVPFSGPVSLSVVWHYGWRKAESKKNKAFGYKWCDKRPDCDNLVKMVKDVFTDLNYWGDDSQVARLMFEKCWSDRPGIGICIEGLEES